jgi:nucleoid-associated protein YgaU
VHRRPRALVVLTLTAELTIAAAAALAATCLATSLPAQPPAEHVALPLTLLGASMAATWLLVVTAAAVAAELPLGRDVRWIRGLGARAPSRLRGLVRTAVPLVALASTLAPVATGATTRAEPVVRGAETSVSARQPVVRAPAPDPRRPPQSPPLSAAHGHAAEHVHVVVAGDNLWTIAAARLADAHGARPSSSQIVPYWRAVIAANVGTLRSGNPNLIFPGEAIALPRL